MTYPFYWRLASLVRLFILQKPIRDKAMRYQPVRQPFLTFAIAADEISDVGSTWHFPSSPVCIRKPKRLVATKVRFRFEHSALQVASSFKWIQFNYCRYRFSSPLITLCCRIKDVTSPSVRTSAYISAITYFIDCMFFENWIRICSWRAGKSKCAYVYLFVHCAYVCTVYVRTYTWYEMSMRRDTSTQNADMCLIQIAKSCRRVSIHTSCVDVPTKCLRMSLLNDLNHFVSNFDVIICSINAWIVRQMESNMRRVLAIR